MRISAKNILWAIAFLFIGIAYILGLFIDLTGDSGLYAAISLQMVESGDWLNLKINGEPYDQKPHLMFWLAGFGIKLFGNTNFAFKIFPTIWGLTGFYFTYKLSELLFSREVGKLAVLITSSSLIFILYFFDIHTDTILQTGVMLALWQLLAYLKNKKIIHFIGGFLGVGLAMLSKGPVGAVIPFLVVLFFLIDEKRYKELLHPKWLFGIVISLLVISPTLFHLFSNFGWEGIRFYFITNNFGRISGDYAGSSNDYLFYIHTVLWALLPWTVFVLVSFYLELKDRLINGKNKNNTFYLFTSVLVFIFIISIAKGKAPNYSLMVIPVFAVITAKWISSFHNFSGKMKSRLINAQQILLAILFLLFLGIVFVLSESLLIIPGFLIVIPVVLFILSVKFITDKIHRIILQSVFVISTLFLFLSGFVIPELFKYQGARQVLYEFEKNRNPDDKLYNLHLEEFELFYYSDWPVKQIHNYEEYRNVLKQDNVWIYTTEEGYNGILDNINKADTLIYIKHRGMNEINFQFLNPGKRIENLKTNYLIKK